MEIRKFKPEDADACLELVELNKQHMGDLYNRDELIEHAEQVSFWVVEEKGKIVGMATFSDLKNGIGMFGSLAVHPDHQGKGIGGKLVEHIKNEVSASGFRKLMYITHVKNIPMIILGLKRGFIMEGLLKGGFRTGTDAYYMSYFYPRVQNG